MEATNQLQHLLRKWKKEFLTNWENHFKEIDIIEDDIDIERVQILSDLYQKGGADLKYLEEERGFVLIPHVFWSVRLIRFFMKKGLNVNSQDEFGDTALHLALRYLRDPIRPTTNRTDTIKLLILKPVPKIIKFLVKRNVDPNVTNSRGETPLFTLSREVVRYSDVNKHIIVKVAEMLVKRGAKVQTFDIDGESMLYRKYRNTFYSVDEKEKHRAAENRNHKNVCVPCRFIERFKENNAVEVRTPSWLYTPLMLAANENRLQCCRCLVETLGADLNATDFQGYTALHHAATSTVIPQLNFPLINSKLEVEDPAKLLIELGADPEKKSALGRDFYQVAILGPRKCNLIAYGAKPVTKKIELLEFAVAVAMFAPSKHVAKVLWEELTNMCRELNLQPSQDYKRNNELFSFYFSNNRSYEFNTTCLACLNTVIRLSEGTNLKFWNGLCYSVSHSGDPFVCLDEMLSNQNFKLQQCPEDLASEEELDFKSLSDLSELFRNWLYNYIILDDPEKNEERISQFHFFATLSVACFNKLIKEINCDSKRLPGFTCIHAYVNICHTLAAIRSNFGDFISEDAFKENERLLKTLVDLDLRDQDGNTLLHLSFKTIRKYYRWYSKFNIQSLEALLDFVDVKESNSKGFEPVQCINWNQDELWWLLIDQKSDQQSFCDVMIKMADRGAHIDGKNAFEGPTLRHVFEIIKRHDLSFHYDTLKCMCARVLIRSLVPFKNRASKPIVDFILKHDPLILVPMNP